MSAAGECPICLLENCTRPHPECSPADPARRGEVVDTRSREALLEQLVEEQARELEHPDWITTDGGSEVSVGRTRQVSIDQPITELGGRLHEVLAAPGVCDECGAPLRVAAELCGFCIAEHEDAA